MKLPSSCPQWRLSSFPLQPTSPVTGRTGRLVPVCNQSSPGESSITTKLGQHRSVPGYLTSISSSLKQLSLKVVKAGTQSVCSVAGWLKEFF